LKTDWQKSHQQKKIKTNNGEESHNGVAKTQDYIQSRAENGSHSDGKKITTDTPTKENNGIHSNNVMEQKLQEKKMDFTNLKIHKMQKYQPNRTNKKEMPLPRAYTMKLGILP